MNLPKGFDLDLALELADLSNDAYRQYDAYKKGEVWKGPAGYKLNIIFKGKYDKEDDKDAPLGFIASKGDNVYISWRGTSSFKEWIEDAKFNQTRCFYLKKNVKVESGFYEMYIKGGSSSPQNIILNFLKEKQIKGNLYVTGHSMGAALAVLNILDIAMNANHSNVVLYSFAGPRAGSLEYASVYNSKISNSWRVVNSNDEVPKLPPKDILENHYKHVDQGFDITFGGKMPWDWVDDHILDNYIKQLKKLKQYMIAKSI